MPFRIPPGVAEPPTGPAGGDLAGTYPNPTLAAIIAAGGPTGSATVTPVVTYDAKGRLTAVTTANIAGVTPAGAAGGDLTGTYPNPTILAASRSVDEIKAAAGGWISQNMPREAAQWTTTLAAQTLRAHLIGLRAGQVITGLASFLDTLGATPGNLSYAAVGLYNAALSQVATSGNVVATFQSGAGQIKAVPFTGAYTVPTSGGYYAVILFDHTAAGIPGMASSPGSVGTLSNSVGPAVGAGIQLLGRQSGQASLPGTLTLLSSGTVIWMAAY